MRALDDTDRKRLRDILLQHPLLETEHKRHALLINSSLASLLDEVDPKEDIYDFIVLLFAQLIKNLAMTQSGNPWLVSLLNYLIDFSRPEDLTQSDRQFVIRLSQRYSRQPAQSQARTTHPTDNNDSSTEKEATLPARRSQETITRKRKDLESAYLKRVIKGLEWLEITGLPRGIVAQSAPLDEVFIPLQFRPNRPLTEYPLTEKELAAYYQSLQDNQPQRALERVIFEAEKNWSTVTRTSETISINDFWQRLTQGRPAAVIQGYPGMGKSTFLRYLALYMARRRLKQRSEGILAPLTPALIPFLVSLGDFARARVEHLDLTLLSYLQLTLERLPIPGVAHLLATSLEAGSTLILLDGLDEVSDQEMRMHIQTEIKHFISYYGDTFEEKTLFNRFIVTTRVAGYDQAAFPSYPHYTIAELTSEQIDGFLPRWCRAIVRLDPAFTINNQAQTQAFAQEVKRRTEALRTIIRNRPELQTLVENPLLLTLLALMQQNQVEIPRQRVDLYRIFTQTLLERRSEIAGAPLVPETQALLRLGPIAFRMQETNNGFMHQNGVVASLLNTIGLEEGVINVRQEAEEFLYKMRVHVGIFLLRAGDFYAFLHRTFQEYFAARYMLHAMTHREEEITRFIDKTYQDYATWREPFLLAIAYASSKDITLANKMMSGLLTMPPGIDAESHTLRLQIAVESLIEARPASIDPALERRIAEQLLQLYEEAQQSWASERCALIEGLVQNWLFSLPRHTHYATVLDVLREAISNRQQVSHQRATLTLVAAFIERENAASIEQQKPWPDCVIATLIPPLLSLAGLPAIGPYQPVAWLPASSNMAIADLALIVLSLLRMQGPAGLLPTIVRRHFAAHPEQLHILAQHSVASNILLTPTIIPRKDEFSYHWPGDPFLRQWLSLRDGPHAGHTQEEKERICFTVQQGLLQCAEEMRYPLTLHIIQVLQQAQKQPEKPWQGIWQDYLLERMDSDHYVSYQESTLLWSILFSEPQGLKKLVEILLGHLDREGSPAQRHAQRFLATLADSLRIQEELRVIGELDGGKEFLQHIRFWLDIYEVLEQDTQNLRYWRYLRDMHNLQHLRDMQGEEPLHNPQAILRLQAFLFTPEITQRCCARLTLVSLEQDEYVDLLTVLLGRVLTIWTTEARGADIEQELQQLVQALRLDISPVEYNERSAIVLDFLRYLRFLPVLLPVSTPEEVSNILRLAEIPKQQWLQQVCSEALQHARPEILEAGKLLRAERQFPTRIGEPVVQQDSTPHAAEPPPGTPTADTASPQFQSRESPTEASASSTGKRAIERELFRCDVCVVCALSEETEIFMREASRLCNASFQPTFGPRTKRSYRYTIIENNQGEPLTMYVTWLPSYGPAETGLHLKPVFSELQPRFTAMTGICAGDREKTALGDIIVAERAFLHDTGKIVPDIKGRKKLLPDTRTWHPNQDILHFVHLFDAWKSAVVDLKRPISKRQQRDWLLRTLLQETTSRVDDIPLEELTQNAPAWKKIMHELQSASQPYLTRDRALCDPARVRELYYGKDDFPFHDPEQPKCHVVPLASGSTVRSDNPFEEIRRPVRGAIAVDMEGAIFYRTVADFPGLHSLLIKGVCDYADPEKDDSYHEYASAVSAIYTLCFIKEYVTTTLIPDRHRD